MGTDIHIAVEIRKPDGWHLIAVPVTENRNYRSFAVLADVRNGYGFAGSDTGDEVTPISEPRGLPDDMSPELRLKLDGEERAGPAFEDQDEQYFWLGDHSFSWVTLKELLDYDLDAPINVRGYVSEQAAKDYREKGILPGSSAGWTSLPGFVKLEWQVPLRESASLVGQLIEEIRDLGKPEDVRLVFGFDS